MKSILFPCRLFTTWQFLGLAAVVWSLMAGPPLQAQTNFNFNSGTDPGWLQWLPEFYGADDGNGNFTNAIILPSVTFATNDSSAGNLAYFLHAGTSNASALHPPSVASFFTNTPPLTNFTMTGEFFNWTNGQGQEFGLAARVQLPFSPVNVPNVESSTNSYGASGIILVYANARSAKNFASPPVSGSTDNLRMYWVSPTNSLQQITSSSLNGPGANYTVGRSLSPVSPNGRYRLIFTANLVGDLTGQLVDLSTGLPLSFAPGVYSISRNMVAANAGLAAVTNVGGAFGVISLIGSSGASLPQPGNNTVGQALDPKFDNVAIVPGVVTLQSAAAVTGPFAADTSAGIEVNPMRITVPVNGDVRFYRINWFGCDHTPTITSIAMGPTVNVVTANGTTTTVTNAVQTMVLTYN